MDNLKIYIDRLKEGQVVRIDESLPPDFLEIDEEDLIFEDPIQVKGQAYLADDHLITCLDMETVAYLPCNICNDDVKIPIAVKNATLTQPLSEIDGAIYDLADEVRESLLLQTPLFAECSEGNCPERESLKKFLGESEPKTDVIHFPFADL